MSIITNWGSTFPEREQTFTCDTLIKKSNGAYFRAVDISAPPELVFRWMCQMKIAPYSYDRLDNGGKQSPQQLIPGIDNLKINDKMMTIFNVSHFVTNKEMTLVMDIPPKPFDVYYVPTAITYKITPSRFSKKDQCRLVVKYVARWKNTFLGISEKLFIIFADFVMMRRQLLNFKKLAERDYVLTKKSSN